MIDRPGDPTEGDLNPLIAREKTTATSQIVPLYAEDLSISRRRVETGIVRVATTTDSHDVLIDEVLVHQRVEIERTQINRFVENVPPVRQEGETTIIPVIE